MEMRQLAKMPGEKLQSLMEGMGEEDIEILREQLELFKAKQMSQLESLGDVIAGKRKESIDYRANLGIESDWQEDEEYYQGIDSYTGGFESDWEDKPPGRSGEAIDQPESSIFLNITAPYCDAAAASLADMLLPTDETSWDMSVTPVPELVPLSEGDIPRVLQQQILQASGGNQQAAQQQAQKMVAQAQEMIKEADKKCQAAKKRMEDWLVECQYHDEVRKVIEDVARVGSGVLKGPVPALKRHVAFSEQNNSLAIMEEIQPESKWISYKNLYPAKGCGENIHNGEYIFERDDINAKQLRDLIDQPGYIPDQILEVLDEGPQAAEVEKDVDDKNVNEGTYEIWYYYGELNQEDMQCICDMANNMDDYLDEENIPERVFAQVTMVNNRVIKAVLNPLDDGDFPYDVMVWKRRRGTPWGFGVAREIRTAQRMLNGAARNLMDNAGLAGGPMCIIDTRMVVPVDGVGEVAPRKIYIPANDVPPGADLRNAITYAKIDMYVEELQAIMYFALKIAEDVTGMPMILQGQMGAQKLDTLGQTQILNNNANIVRRRIARLFDGLVTEPHIRRYYKYLLQYGDDAEKGDFVIDAKGSSNLVERSLYSDQLIQLLELSQNPVYKKDPAKVFDEYLKSQKLTPERFEFDDEQWQKVIENLSQPQQDPRAEIAQMQGQIAQMKEQMATQRLQMEIQSRERIETAKLQTSMAETSQEIQSRERIEAARAQLTAAIKQLDRKMEHDSKKDIQLDKLKVDLNKTLMELQTTQKLVNQRALASELPKPPVEPPQRAPTGESYQQ